METHSSSSLHRFFLHLLRASYRAGGHTTRFCMHSLRWAIKILIVLYFLFCLLFLVLRYGVLPNIEHYKSDIEQSASKAIGRTVTATSLKAYWLGFHPTLALRNVVIRDQSGQAALTLPEVSATLSWWSIPAFDIRFSKIEIIRPELDVQRQADGTFSVAGFIVDPNKSDDGKGLDWVFSQREIIIRRGIVDWSDVQAKTPALHLTEVNFILDNNWRHHRFALKAVPPATLAAPFDIRGDFHHPVFTKKISDFSQWSGEIFTDLRQADLAELKRFIAYPADVQKGYGTVYSWIRINQDRIVDFTADIRLLDVVGRLRNDLPILDMAKVSGRFIATEKNPLVAKLGAKLLPSVFGQAGHSISLIDFVMETRDGVALPATTIKETYSPATEESPEKVELFAKILDLQTLANFAEHLPLPADQRQMLIDFAPRGQLKDFTAKWVGSYPHIVSYKVDGNFTHLSMNARAAQLGRAKVGDAPAQEPSPAIPGFENLSGTIDATEKGGSFTLNSNDILLHLPTYFFEPMMPFNLLKMRANWQFQAQNQLLVKVANLEFRQDDFTGVLSGQYTQSIPHSATQSPIRKIEIDGKLNGFEVKKVDRFIPTSAPADLRYWLSNALVDGRLDDMSVKVKGDLARFPFVTADGKPTRDGEFLVKGKIVDGKLDFAPGMHADDGVAPLWPSIDAIKGSIVFDHARMEIKGDTAKTLGADIAKVTAVIPDLVHVGSVLNIDGSVSGNLQNMLQYIGASPVDGWLGHFLQDAKANANAQLALKLSLPLTHLIDSKANGILQFNSNEVVLVPGAPVISALNGKLEFNERGVQLNNVKGVVLGGATNAIGGSQKDGSVRIKLDGTASADGIRKALPQATADKIGAKLSGATRYSATINVRKRQPEVLIESSLQGLGVGLPAPLRKQVNDVLPLRFEMNAVASNDSTMLRDEVKVSLGNAVAARYQRRRLVDHSQPWQVIRGGIAVNAPMPDPEFGLNANVDLPALNVDDWKSILSPSVSGNSATSASVDLSPYIEPDVVAVRTNELQVIGKKVENVIVGASRQRGNWQANLESSQVSGYLTWSGATGAQNIGNISARLSRLIIPQSAAGDVSDLLEGKNITSQIPGLDIVADDFELANKKFGRLEVVANNLAVQGGREWRINKLSLKNDDAELKGTGKWSNRVGENTTTLNYQLEISNAGKLLDRLGFANVMRGGKGKLEGELHWNGLPFAFDTPSMSGQVQLDVASGQFLKVDASAAKLLGVLSMQSLPRRFTLDFRDVFSEGFAFDTIVGSAQIAQGIAKTDNLKMRSANATVLMDGTADIVKESQNLHVAVIPEVNAGTASVMYGLAVNPAIGLGTFLAQLFLREPLARAFTYEYQVAGSWKDPTVTKYENKGERPEPKRADSAPNSKNSSEQK